MILIDLRKLTTDTHMIFKSSQFQPIERAHIVHKNALWFSMDKKIGVINLIKELLRVKKSPKIAKNRHFGHFGYFQITLAP